jgi:hypothetical protein
MDSGDARRMVAQTSLPRTRQDQAGFAAIAQV